MTGDRPVVVTPAALRAWPLPGPGGSGEEPAGKESRGSVLVVGGSLETPGAALLAGLAALRAGAGKLQIATAGTAAAALAVAVPEALVRGLPLTPGGALDPDAAARLEDLAGSADCVLVGPGLTDPAAAGELVAALVPLVAPGATLVVDALGLAGHEAVAGRAGPTVLTPNAAEMTHLAGLGAEEVADEPAAVVARVARDTGAVVTLRGADSWVADPAGGLWHEGGGGIGLGTSGSGDVLAGVVAGLAARGAEAAQAAVWGVHIHAEAGQRLAARVGRLGFLARELLDEVPGVLVELQS